MAGNLSPSEQAQLLQTIEMFELIAQSQPNDSQSLEILKEAYSKLGREEDLIRTTRMMAKNYVQLGQYSSAIFEYESILQRHPEDAEALQALAGIEATAGGLQTSSPTAGETEAAPAPEESRPLAGRPGALAPIDDGRQTMVKHFVGSKLISQGDFDLCWPDPRQRVNGQVIEPFIQALAERGTVPIDKSIRVLLEKSRLAYVPIDKYDADLDVARSFPVEVCRRWCVLPFDRMSKSILVATANPFNRQAAHDLEAATQARLIYYLAPPQEIIKGLKKAFR